MTLAANRVLIGGVKQAAKGAQLAPTWFPRWENGTNFEPDTKFEKIREGDGTVGYTQLIKNLQFWKGKLVMGKARAIDIGFLIGAVLGNNSDRSASNGIVGTAGSKVGTMGVLAVGATTGTYTLTSGAAPVIGDVFQIDVNAGATTAETVKLTNVTGAGPYTLTWAAADALLFGHLAAAPANNVVAPFTHTFVPQLSRFYWSMFQQYLFAGQGASPATPEAVALVDAMFHSMVLEGTAGKIIAASGDCNALGGSDYTTPITPSLDASSAPLLYYGGTFNVDGSLVGSTAPYLKRAKLSYKHPLDDSLQTEAATLADFVSTVREVELELDVLWQDFSMFKKTYFGSTGGTADSALQGTGSIDIKWLAGGSDVNNSLEFIGSNVAYTAAPLGTPALDGKAMVQKVTANLAVSPEVKILLKNGQYSGQG